MMPKSLAPESSLLTTRLYLPISEEGSDVFWGLLQHLFFEGLSNNANSLASHLFKELAHDPFLQSPSVSSLSEI